MTTTAAEVEAEEEDAGAHDDEEENLRENRDELSKQRRKGRDKITCNARSWTKAQHLNCCR